MQPVTHLCNRYACTLCGGRNLNHWINGFLMAMVFFASPCFAQVREEYPEIESSHWYVDALTMQMVKNPTQFQVIVTCNMFGDIVSDLGAQLAGGLGLAPSGNINPASVSMFGVAIWVWP